MPRIVKEFTVPNLNHARAMSPRRTASAYLATAGLALSLVLAGCSKPVEKVEEVRPVRAIKMTAANSRTVAQFSGEIRARYESRLGFRVGGKIVARKVDVGAMVKRGQLLMQLDPQDLQLAQSQANAALGAAESNLELAKAELARYKDLREKNFVSQAVLDAKETAYRSARATRDQAAAALRTQRNQTGYGNLVADVDGVVTGIDAETGQVVAAGTPVVRLAQLGEKEVVISIPEDQVDALRKVSDVTVRTWANPDEALPGKLRELSPVADTATRTYTAKISLPKAPEDVRLGMTAYVTFSANGENPMLKVPLTALVQNQGASAVWLVENGTVRLAPVQLAGASGNEMLIASGINPGQVVVTAGVHLLKPGQKVTVLDAEPVAQNNAGTAK
ncbi:efflux RND transporter periplasmic adaptor subunit [Noviherbaspirillum sp. L7-7A]|uniref:efflux RND transporter periplasmic adaptor subunit n=1 Tax=Noviherbaspirillum sp. L7-7A TaxID=2850560 RepID=UPI0032C4A905